MKFADIYGEYNLKPEKQKFNFKIPIVKSADVTIKDDLKETFNNLTNTIETIDDKNKILPWHWGAGGVSIMITIIFIIITVGCKT